MPACSDVDRVFALHAGQPGPDRAGLRHSGGAHPRRGRRVPRRTLFTPDPACPQPGRPRGAHGRLRRQDQRARRASRG
ncbi:MAG: hypothetical protein MZV70_55615 [Desulfobacterales bacterium]|nr:hypothetical protein [Desulfobacterales bacterium]